MVPIPPQAAAAAATTAKAIAVNIVAKAGRAIIGIFDPGVRRDRNREARAQMWFEFAQGGSITAARTLHGGAVVQYTAKERGMYETRWSAFASSDPDLARAALARGDLGVPEPGSGEQPASLPQSGSSTGQDLANLQAEMDAYNGASSGSSSNATAAPAGESSGNLTVLLVILAVGAVTLVGFLLATKGR